LSGFEPIHSWQEILLPLNIPLLAPFLNRFLVRLWPFNHFALTNFLMARKQPEKTDPQESSSISIIVPARNEAGNIHKIFDTLPDFGTNFELVFVEGGSSDETFKAIEDQIRSHPEVECHLLKQTSTGKRDAVRQGFDQAHGEILMILDADLTVPFGYLPRFYEAIRSGRGDFINGVRLVYPLEKDSMRYANILGNKFFSIVFSWILGQPIKDTLCGTKVLRKTDYLRIARNRETFGDFDPFGDFDLLLGAGKLNLKIVDIPVRYQPRSYGSTNISRWKHGMYLLKMAAFGMWKIKFQ
jgi:glycosyltransferase involved in cell wall biosynthesis